MNHDCQAVIEIGTNSVKLLVGRSSKEGVVSLRQASTITRLGQGLEACGRLRPDAIARTVEAVTEFDRQAQACAPRQIRILVTCAGREALNRSDLLQAVEQRTGKPVEVISGPQEAALAFQGVTTDPALVRQALLVVDLGGGSSEFIVGHNQEMQWRISVPLGCLRLLDQLKPSDPPFPAHLAECRTWIADFLEYEVAPLIVPALRRLRGHAPRLVGVGGTAAALNGLCVPAGTVAISGETPTTVERAALASVVKRLWGMTLAERSQLPGLPPQRADTILMGAPVLLEIMRRFHFEELTISRRGVRFGALQEVANGAVGMRVPQLQTGEGSRRPPELRTRRGWNAAEL